MIEQVLFATKYGAEKFPMVIIENGRILEHSLSFDSGSGVNKIKYLLLVCCEPQTCSKGVALLRYFHAKHIYKNVLKTQL